jgi:hypothetical protein
MDDPNPRVHTNKFPDTLTNALLYSYIMFILKLALKHLKSSYMFRSTDHPQEAHVVRCWSYVKMISKTLRYFNRWCGSISCVLCTLFVVQGGRVSLPHVLRTLFLVQRDEFLYLMSYARCFLRREIRVSLPHVLRTLFLVQRDKSFSTSPHKKQRT